MGCLLSKFECCKPYPILDSSDLRLDSDTSASYYEIKDQTLRRKNRTIT